MGLSLGARARAECRSQFDARNSLCFCLLSRDLVDSRERSLFKCLRSQLLSGASLAVNSNNYTLLIDRYTIVEITP